MKKLLGILILTVLFIIGCDVNNNSNIVSIENDRRNITYESIVRQIKVELYFDGEYFSDNHIDSIFYDNEMVTMYFMKGIMKYEFYPISKISRLKIIVEN